MVGRYLVVHLADIAQLGSEDEKHAVTAANEGGPVQGCPAARIPGIDVPAAPNRKSKLTWGLNRSI